MLILKIIVLSQVLVANKMLAVNKVDGIQSNNKLIKNCRKLSKLENGLN